MNIPMKYVIVYRNDPRYAGTDCYYVTDDKVANRFDEATVMSQDEAILASRRVPVHDDGHLVAQVVSVIEKKTVTSRTLGSPL